eukprot:7295491-Prymnesium_polylepis.3
MAATTMSARRTCDGRSAVREWQTVTVASIDCARRGDAQMGFCGPRHDQMCETRLRPRAQGRGKSQTPAAPGP